MPEASLWKEPFSEREPPKITESGLSALIGLILFSLLPKKLVTSISTFPGLWAVILKPFNTGSAKLLLNEAAMGSPSFTTFPF